MTSRTNLCGVVFFVSFFPPWSFEETGPPLEPGEVKTPEPERFVMNRWLWLAALAFSWSTDRGADPELGVRRDGKPVKLNIFRIFISPLSLSDELEKFPRPLYRVYWAVIGGCMVRGGATLWGVWRWGRAVERRGPGTGFITLDFSVSLELERFKHRTRTLHNVLMNVRAGRRGRNMIWWNAACINLMLETVPKTSPSASVRLICYYSNGDPALI